MTTENNFRELLREMRSDTVFLWTSRITLGTCIPGLLILVLVWQRLPPQIPFFYSLPWGEEQLAEPLSLIMLMFTAGFIYIANLTIGVFTKPVSLFLSRLLLIGGMTLTLLSFYTIVRIIVLIT